MRQHAPEGRSEEKTNFNFHEDDAQKCDQWRNRANIFFCSKHREGMMEREKVYHQK